MEWKQEQVWSLTEYLLWTKVRYLQVLKKTKTPPKKNPNQNKNPDYHQTPPPPKSQYLFIQGEIMLLFIILKMFCNPL